MNNARRKELTRIANELETLFDQLSEVVSQLESVKEEEQETYDNMPESFQNGDKGERVTAAVDALEEAISAVDVDNMRGALEYISTASE